MSRLITIANKLLQAKTIIVNRARVHINPTATQIKQWIDNKRCKFCSIDEETIVRLLYDIADKMLYAWCGHEETHGGVAVKLFGTEYDYDNIYMYWIDCKGGDKYEMGGQEGHVDNLTINRLFRMFPKG